MHVLFLLLLLLLCSYLWVSTKVIMFLFFYLLQNTCAIYINLVYTFAPPNIHVRFLLLTELTSVSDDSSQLLFLSFVTFDVLWLWHTEPYEPELVDVTDFVEVVDLLSCFIIAINIIPVFEPQFWRFMELILEAPSTLLIDIHPLASKLLNDRSNLVKEWFTLIKFAMAYKPAIPNEFLERFNSTTCVLNWRAVHNATMAVSSRLQDESVTDVNCGSLLDRESKRLLEVVVIVAFNSLLDLKTDYTAKFFPSTNERDSYRTHLNFSGSLRLRYTWET